MSKEKLSIIGAGGHAKVVIEIAEMLDYEIVVFDDNPNVKEVLEYPVKHDFELLKTDVFFGLGNNVTRKEKAKIYKQNTPNLIHPKSTLSKRINIGKGNVIMGGVVINSSVEIGNYCIINTSASIDHDCIIHDFVHISPKAVLAGNVEIGEGTQVGMNACVKQNIKIGKWCVVGMGAVVINDIPDNSIVIGNPARIIKKNS